MSVSHSPVLMTKPKPVASPDAILVIGDSSIDRPAGFEDAALRFVDPGCAASLLQRERPAAVIADLALLSRSPCGIELRRFLDALVMQGEVRVTWVRSD